MCDSSLREVREGISRVRTSIRRFCHAYRHLTNGSSYHQVRVRNQQDLPYIPRYIPDITSDVRPKIRDYMRPRRILAALNHPSEDKSRPQGRNLANQERETSILQIYLHGRIVIEVRSWNISRDSRDLFQ